MVKYTLYQQIEYISDSISRSRYLTQHATHTAQSSHVNRGSTFMLKCFRQFSCPWPSKVACPPMKGVT